MKALHHYKLHIYWDDDVTIEWRYFERKKGAMEYVKDNGIDNYDITREDGDIPDVRNRPY